MERENIEIDEIILYQNTFQDKLLSEKKESLGKYVGV